MVTSRRLSVSRPSRTVKRRRIITISSADVRALRSIQRRLPSNGATPRFDAHPGAFPKRRASLKSSDRAPPMRESVEDDAAGFFSMQGLGARSSTSSYKTCDAGEFFAAQVPKVKRISRESFESDPGFFAAQGLETKRHSFASLDATPCGFERVRINSIKSSEALPPPLENSASSQRDSSERQTPATIEKDTSYESILDSETMWCSPRESPIWI